MNNHKVALVTGVSSGIGQEIARLLTEQGLKVFGTSRRPGAGLIQLDVTDDDSVAEAVRSVLHQAGRIDVLINNAGYVLAGALEETSIDEARQQFDTNFFGVKVSRLRRFVPARMFDSTFCQQFQLDEPKPGRNTSRATTTSDENRQPNYANDLRHNRATTQHESLRPT